MFFADQVIQTLDIPETSSTPSYVSLERLSSLLQNFTDQVVQLLDVFPTRYRLQSIQMARKVPFFKLISALVSTRSFPRGFSLATPNYVLVDELPSLLQKYLWLRSFIIVLPFSIL
jgi:hypothetical protein